jgi:hypothetical protein
MVSSVRTTLKKLELMIYLPREAFAATGVKNKSTGYSQNGLSVPTTFKYIKILVQMIDLPLEALAATKVSSVSQRVFCW